MGYEAITEGKKIGNGAISERNKNKRTSQNILRSQYHRMTRHGQAAAQSGLAAAESDLDLSVQRSVRATVHAKCDLHVVMRMPAKHPINNPSPPELHHCISNPNCSSWIGLLVARSTSGGTPR